MDDFTRAFPGLRPCAKVRSCPSHEAIKRRRREPCTTKVGSIVIMVAVACGLQCASTAQVPGAVTCLGPQIVAMGLIHLKKDGFDVPPIPSVTGEEAKGSAMATAGTTRSDGENLVGAFWDV